MKELVIFLALMAVAAIGQPVFGQTAQEKKQMSLIEAEIARLENEVRVLEKNEERQTAKDKFELRRQIRELELRADPRRAKSEEDMLFARTEMNKLWLKIDSLDSLIESFEISFKREEIDRYQDERQAMIKRWTAPSNTIPREMRVVTKNRRLRANEVRREDLVISKIENNLNSAISPTADKSGYQIILDNKSPHLVTFMLRGIKGGESVSFTLSPRTKERHAVVPDVYFVDFFVNGRKVQTQEVNKMTIDGQVRYYEGEPTFGYAYKSAW